VPIFALAVVWDMCPQFNLAFSLEEAPTFGRGSSLRGKEEAMEERRGNRRISSRFEINYVNEGDYLISYSKDLSVDGMFVSTDSPPGVGEETKLTFSIGNIDRVTVDARVVWVNTSDQEDKAGMGVEFINPPNSLREAILDNIKKIAVLLNGPKN
jgi:uncharacterized protein (TIGR02266 family)